MQAGAEFIGIARMSLTTCVEVAMQPHLTFLCGIYNGT